MGLQRRHSWDCDKIQQTAEGKGAGLHVGWRDSNIWVSRNQITIRGIFLNKYIRRAVVVLLFLPGRGWKGNKKIECKNRAVLVPDLVKSHRTTNMADMLKRNSTKCKGERKAASHTI